MKRILALLVLATACGQKDSDKKPAEGQDAVVVPILDSVVPAKTTFQVGEKFTFQIAAAPSLESVHLVKIGIVSEDLNTSNRTWVCDSHPQSDNVWITDCAFDCLNAGNYLIDSITMFLDSDKQIRYEIDRRDGFYFDAGNQSEKSTSKYQSFSIQHISACTE